MQPCCGSARWLGLSLVSCVIRFVAYLVHWQPRERGLYEDPCYCVLLLSHVYCTNFACTYVLADPQKFWTFDAELPRGVCAQAQLLPCRAPRTASDMTIDHNDLPPEQSLCGLVGLVRRPRVICGIICWPIFESPTAIPPWMQFRV